jgi:hypothetical protein
MDFDDIFSEEEKKVDKSVKNLENQNDVTPLKINNNDYLTYLESLFDGKQLKYIALKFSLPMKKLSFLFVLKREYLDEAKKRFPELIIYTPSEMRIILDFPGTQREKEGFFCYVHNVKKEFGGYITRINLNITK